MNTQIFPTFIFAVIKAFNMSKFDGHIQRVINSSSYPISHHISFIFQHT